MDGFHWADKVDRMTDEQYTATIFLNNNVKPSKRAKLVRKKDGKWQWLCPADEMHFFNDPAPPGNVIDYLEVSEDCYEYCFPKRDIEVWNTGDFYLDGDGFFIHKDCDQDNRTTIRYVLQKTSGHWDIVTKVKVPQINRRGKAVKRLTMDCDKWLVFYPQKDYKRYCAPQRLPVWLPHSFADTLPQWDRDDQDTVQDLFYLVVGYTTPMKAKIFKVEHGPIHKWTDLSKHHPQLVEDLEVEALMSAQKILSDNALEEMGDSVDSPYTTRTKKAVEFLSRFVHAAVTVVAMVVTIVKVWDDIFFKITYFFQCSITIITT